MPLLRCLFETLYSVVLLSFIVIWLKNTAHLNEYLHNCGYGAEDEKAKHTAHKKKLSICFHFLYAAILL